VIARHGSGIWIRVPICREENWRIRGSALRPTRTQNTVFYTFFTAIFCSPYPLPNISLWSSGSVPLPPLYIPGNLHGETVLLYPTPGFVTRRRRIYCRYNTDCLVPRVMESCRWCKRLGVFLYLSLPSYLPVVVEGMCHKMNIFFLKAYNNK
jgi:hypothetical protein